MECERESGSIHGGRAPDDLTLAVLSLELPGSACMEIRIRGPLDAPDDRFRIASCVTILDGSRCAVDLKGVEGGNIIVIQRFFPSRDTAGTIDRVFRTGKPVVYEADDLVVELPDANPHKAWADDRAPFVKNVIRQADAVVASTEPLAAEFRRLNPNVVVLPNLVDERIWRDRSIRKESAAPFVIGYTGTKTHARDLSIVEDALFEIARRHPGRVEFLFMGFVTEKLRMLPGLRFVDFSDSYRDYARRLPDLGIDLAIVPLEDNRFNRCKSHIKWLEYGICGIPGVFSDLPPYHTSVRNGETGLLVRNDARSWVGAIEAALRDPKRGHAVGEAARAEILARHTVAVGGKARRDAYRAIDSEIRSGRTGRMPDRSDRTQNGKSGKRGGVEMEPVPKVSVIIPCFNNVRYTRVCLETLAATTRGLDRGELIVVDNGSTDETQALLSGVSGDMTVVRNAKNLGFARGCNQGASLARGEYLLFLNNDTEMRCEGWLDALILAADETGAPICGAKLLYPDGTIQHAGVAFGDAGIGYHIFRGHPGDDPAVNRRRDFQAVTAACMLVRRDLFLSLGGFDEGYVNGFEDVDFCLRGRAAGHRIVYVPEAELIHHEEKSAGRKDRDGENLVRFLAQWKGRVEIDDGRIFSEAGYRKEPSADGSTVRYVQAPSAVPPRCLKQERRYPEALAAFCKAWATGDDSAAADVGDCLAALGRIDEAREVYSEAVAANPKDARASAGMGVLDLASGDSESAISRFEHALRADPGEVSAWAGKWIALRASGGSAEEMASLLAVIERQLGSSVERHEVVRGAQSGGVDRE